MKITVLSIAVVAGVAAVLGCGVDATEKKDPPSYERTAPEEFEEETTLATTIAAGVCGDGSGNTLLPVEAQKRVTKAWQYLLGADTSPTEKYPCADGKELPLSNFRSLLAKGTCSATNQGRATVCGVTALVYELSCEGLAKAEFDNIVTLATQMDACWGTGVSGLFNVHPGSAWKSRVGNAWTYGLSILVDPSPARLNWWSSLTGAYGSDGAAHYIDTMADVTAYKWSPTYMPNNTIPAGAPCSTTDLAGGDDVPRTIVAYDSLRKCM